MFYGNYSRVGNWKPYGKYIGKLARKGCFSSLSEITNTQLSFSFFFLSFSFFSFSLFSIFSCLLPLLRTSIVARSLARSLKSQKNFFQFFLFPEPVKTHLLYVIRDTWFVLLVNQSQGKKERPCFRSTVKAHISIEKNVVFSEKKNSLDFLFSPENKPTTHAEREKRFLKTHITIFFFLLDFSSARYRLIYLPSNFGRRHVSQLRIGRKMKTFTKRKGKIF